MSASLHTPVALSQGKRPRTGSWMEMKTSLDLEVTRTISAPAAIEIEMPVVDPADSIKRNRCDNLETKPSPQHTVLKTQQRQCIIKARVIEVTVAKP